MAAPKGTQPPGGSRKDIPNKISADVRAMVLAALDRAGGEDYLLEQATANPRAFLSLVGRLIPTRVTGQDDAPSIPDRAADPQRVAHALLLLIASAGAAGEDDSSAV